MINDVWQLGGYVSSFVQKNQEKSLFIGACWIQIAVSSTVEKRQLGKGSKNITTKINK